MKKINLCILFNILLNYSYAKDNMLLMKETLAQPSKHAYTFSQIFDIAK